MATVSVLIPVYNMETYIRQCLDSVLAQTYTDFEVIICDDGSVDSGGMLCDKYAERDTRITVFHKQNEGILKTRRFLLERAKGTFVLWVDADDWIEEDLLKKTVECAWNTGSDVVMFGYCKVTDAGEKIKYAADAYPNYSIYRGKTLHRIYRDFVSSSELNYLWQKLIARKLFSDEDTEDPFGHKYVSGEDKLLLIPVFSKAKCISYIAEPLYFYRMSQSGSGRNFKLNYFSDSIQVGKRVLCFLKTVHADTEENRAKYYTGYLLSMTRALESAVHSCRFDTALLKKTFRQVYESEFYQTAKKYEYRFSGSLLDRIVYALFRRQYFGMLIYLLRFEKRLLDICRTGENV